VTSRRTPIKRRMHSSSNSKNYSSTIIEYSKLKMIISVRMYGILEVLSVSTWCLAQSSTLAIQLYVNHPTATNGSFLSTQQPLPWNFDLSSHDSFKIHSSIQFIGKMLVGGTQIFLGKSRNIGCATYSSYLLLQVFI
jgi:hypothetical protein